MLNLIYHNNCAKIYIIKAYKNCQFKVLIVSDQLLIVISVVSIEYSISDIWHKLGGNGGRSGTGRCGRDGASLL